MSQMTRVGVIGAGRVGTVLAAVLRASSSAQHHEIVAVAAESTLSRERAHTLLVGVPICKPTEVARRSDLLLLTVPDDMLANVANMLVGAGAIRPGTRVVHTSGRHGQAAIEVVRAAGAHPMAIHPAMTFTGTEIDLARLPGCVFGVTVDDADRAEAAALVADLGGTPIWVAEHNRTLYHAGMAHGANHLVTLVAQSMDLLARAGADDPAATLRPLLAAALDNALSRGDAALTGPIVRGDVNTVRAHVADIVANAPDTLASYIALARATADRAVLDGRLLPIRAAAISGVLDDAVAAAARSHLASGASS